MFRDFPPITKNLLIINCIVYMLQLVCEQRGLDLSDWFGLHYVLASDFHVWQLFTYMFLHGSFTHLFFNMFSFWMFGRIIERTMGRKRFLTYYVVCGLGAALCQELWQTGEYFLSGLYQYDLVNTGMAVLPTHQFLNYWTTIGASGACYGVLLAFGMTFPEERIILLIPPIPLKAKYFVVGYAAIELFASFASNSNIAHFAHLGGMLFGLLLILYWRRKERRGGGGFKGWENYQPPRPSLWQRLRGWFKGFGRKQDGPAQPPRYGNADYDYNLRRKEREERIDRILDKVRRSGYESLSDEEKRELFKNSKR